MTVSPTAKKLPSELGSVLMRLASVEREMVGEEGDWDLSFSGEFIASKVAGDEVPTKRWRKKYLDPSLPSEPELTQMPEGLAIIPGFDRNPRQPLLVVAIGTGGDIEEVILQTVEYLLARSMGATKYVIFFAAKWDGIAWARHRDSMRVAKVTSILKLFGTEPMVLNPMY
ncbi:MAG: hypothetical protein ABSG92_11195 [Conexivisphaerales archaeon]|jgi:hypothetical protein